MPLSVLDPVPALVVIDLQNGITGRFAAAVGEPVFDRAATLAGAFRPVGLPVALVTATGVPPGRTDAGRGAAPRPTPPPDWADVIAALDEQPADIRVRKQAWGAFTNTALHGELTARDVTQIVLCGVATSIGVESTARTAHELGYHVVLATDAMADPDETAHRHSLERIMPRLGETATTAEILAALADRTAGRATG